MIGGDKRTIGVPVRLVASGVAGALLPGRPHAGALSPEVARSVGDRSRYAAARLSQAAQEPVTS